MYATTALQAEPKLIFGSWLGSLPTLNFVVVLSNRRSRQSSIKMENCGFIFLYKFLQRAFFHMHTHSTTSTHQSIHPSIHPFGSVNSFARELRARCRTAVSVLVAPILQVVADCQQSRSNTEPFNEPLFLIPISTTRSQLVCYIPTACSNSLSTISETLCFLLCGHYTDWGK